jgi:hypothetical protein
MSFRTPARVAAVHQAESALDSPTCGEVRTKRIARGTCYILLQPKINTVQMSRIYEGMISEFHATRHRKPTQLYHYLTIPNCMSCYVPSINLSDNNYSFSGSGAVWAGISTTAPSVASSATGGPIKTFRPRMRYQTAEMRVKPANTTEA